MGIWDLLETVMIENDLRYEFILIMDQFVGVIGMLLKALRCLATLAVLPRFSRIQQLADIVQEARFPDDAVIEAGAIDLAIAEGLRVEVQLITHGCHPDAMLIGLGQLVLQSSQ